ncbi:MmgE/PrpD family protein [Pigmentiphaga soli]|uniref:MmgE/PrpD family protein n=1 Tax=Pigmentiphaga soli TaxID=1007095 RepID=A0ABP8H9B4_9BURK
MSAVALTLDLGAFIAGLRWADLPADGLDVIRAGFADCVGVMLAGANEDAPRILREMLAPAGGESTLLFTGSRAGALDAAWINGTAAHALDFDDVALRSHPSAVLVPAILAEAEALGASGREMMRAYAAGYEVWAELVRRDQDPQHKKGWHPTGVFGAIGAAAACAALRGLDAAQAAHALGIGASQSAGLIANFGSMTKPFHAGRAAHAGVAAARLAQRGFTASPDALEHPLGWLTAVSLNGRIDRDAACEAGRPWKLTRDRLSIKKYPVCFCAHRALDGMLDLVHDHDLDPASVERVTVSVSRRAAGMLRNAAPQNALEAKFSMQFAMASALISRRAGPEQLSDEFVRRPDVQALMKRVTVTPDDRENSAGYALSDRVQVATGAGVYDSGELVSVRGGPDRPLGAGELREKFEGCLRAGRARVPAGPLFDALMALDTLPHVAGLPGLGPANSPTGAVPA